MFAGRMLAALTVLLFVVGCGPTVRTQYETALATARPPVGDLPVAWKPDADLKLSPAITEQLFRTEVGTIEGLSRRIAIPGGAVTPDLKVEKLRVQSSKKCKECIRVAFDLSGEIRWKLGSKTGRAPVNVSPWADFALEARREGDDWTIVATPREVRLGGLSIGAAGAIVERLVAEWLEQRLRAIEPLTVARFQSRALPLRAARARIEKESVVIDILTSSATSRPLPGGSAALGGSDWALRLHQESLSGLVRAEILERGLIGGKIAADPRSIRLREDAFEILLRIWRPKPLFCGWWRDYRISGDVRIDRAGIRLADPQVTAAGQSFGAPIVDPLVALAEAKILAMIQEAAGAAAPSKDTLPTRRATYTGKVLEIRGSDTHVTLRGSLESTAAGKPAPRGRRGSGDTK